MKVIKTILFWLISWTWGLPMTLIGVVIALCLLITGHKPHRFHYSICFEIGNSWGGFNCGCFFFSNKNPSLSLKQHESGHGLQNLMFGIFMPFVVAIPSCMRYWYREYLVKSGKKKYSELSDYDSMWFEGWATRLGEKHFTETEKF
jgi:Na+/H+ antiporter NhaA